MNFTTYMTKVDEVLEAEAEVDHLDIPDYDYASDFEAGVSPRKAALAALRAAGAF